MPLHKVLLRQLQDDRKQYHQFTNYFLPKISLEVRNFRLVSIGKGVFGNVGVFGDELGDVEPFHILHDVCIACEGDKDQFGAPRDGQATCR